MTHAHPNEDAKMTCYMISIEAYHELLRIGACGLAVDRFRDHSMMVELEETAVVIAAMFGNVVPVERSRNSHIYIAKKRNMV